MNVSLTLLDRNLQLYRYPKHSQHISLQAWDAADEYIIEYVEQHCLPLENKPIVIYNDDFGTLGCWFAHAHPLWVSDSFVAQQSCLMNLKHNALPTEWVKFNDSVTTLTSTVELVLLKIPKTTALLEQQLIDLQPHVSEKTQIIAGAKANRIQKSTLALFEKYLGPTTTSLAKKKARLIFCQPTACKSHKSPYPTIWHTERPNFQISNLANVFARQQLDIGARFILQNFSLLPAMAEKSVIDLGCGNGVLGLHILHQNEGVKVVFVDESHMAIASAKHNVSHNLPDKAHQCVYLVDNCLDNFVQKTGINQVNVVICNPPFHQQNTITDHIAWQMFQDAKKRLKKGGQLFVVGNRHLDYPQKLKKLFGNLSVTASNKKFNIWSATKP